MARRTILLSGLTGNGANGKMSIVLPLGLKYYNIFFEVASGTVAIANITDFKIILNNDLKVEQTGSEQDAANQFDGLAAFSTNSEFRIPFEMLNNFKSIKTQYSTAINTLIPSPKTKKVINAFRIEMTLSGATNPQFNVYADADDSTSEGPGAIQMYRDYLDNMINGEIGTTKLPYGDTQHRFWRRIMIQASAGTVSKTRVLWGAGNEERWNRTSALNNQILTDNKKVPTAASSFYASVTDFTETGIGELWDTNGLTTGDQNLQFLLTGSASGTYTYTVYSLGGL